MRDAAATRCSATIACCWQARRRRRWRCSASASRWCRSTRQICEVTGPARHRRRPTPCRRTRRSTRRASVTDRVRRQRCTTAVELPRRCRRRSTFIPGEVTQVMFESQHDATSRSPAQAIPSYGPRRRGAVFQQARVLLLHAADAAARRDAADAGRVRRRSGAAEGRVDDHAVVHVLRGRRQEPGADRPVSAPHTLRGRPRADQACGSNHEGNRWSHA